MNKDISQIINEAARIKNDYPELKYYEALNKAKEVLGFKQGIDTKKELSDTTLKSSTQ